MFSLNILPRANHITRLENTQENVPSRTPKNIKSKILLKFEKNTFLLNFNLNILSNLSVKKFPVLAKKVEIAFLENKDHFTEKEWKALYKLSENTFVEETESLKQGAAGAGLTDNDW